MHLFRGSGLDGLAAMRPLEQRRIPWWVESTTDSQEVTLLRPLLSEKRSSIESYLLTTGLQPVEDESNAELDFDRNWVRHEILPVIVERWPSAVETMQRSALSLSFDSSFLEMQSEAAYESAVGSDGQLCTNTLLGLDRAIAYRVVRKWLQRLDPVDIGFDVVARIYDLALDQDEEKSVQIGAGQTIVLANRKLMTLEMLRRLAAFDRPIECEDDEVRWEIQVSDAIEDGDAQSELPDSLEVSVRTLRPGDRWYGTRRRVVEDLRKAGIHPLLRPYVLAVTNRDGVLLIPAIYPTIRSAIDEGPVKKVGVRWSRQS